MNHLGDDHNSEVHEINWEILATISRFIKYDPNSKLLTISNGRSRIVMDDSGAIWTKSKRIIHDVEEDLSIEAAWIHLN